MNPFLLSYSSHSGLSTSVARCRTSCPNTIFGTRVGKSASTTPTHCHKAVVLVCYHGDEHAERRLLFGSDARLGRETANAEVE